MFGEDAFFPQLINAIIPDRINEIIGRFPIAIAVNGNWSNDEPKVELVAIVA